MKKISLKNLNLKEVKQLSREQLKNVVGGNFGSGDDCGENAEPNPYPLTGCRCLTGYHFSSPFGKCVESNGSEADPTPKITACKNKQQYDPCSWEHEGTPYTGICDYRMASALYCIDTIFN